MTTRILLCIALFAIFLIGGCGGADSSKTKSDVKFDPNMRLNEPDSAENPLETTSGAPSVP